MPEIRRRRHLFSRVQELLRIARIQENLGDVNPEWIWGYRLDTARPRNAVARYGVLPFLHMLQLAILLRARSRHRPF